jgi:hypothetical protein
MSVSNFNLGRLIKRCFKLKELIVSYCTQITDSPIHKLFQYCKDLEKLEITFCHLITGKCFEKLNPATCKLKHLVIDDCENVNTLLSLKILKKICLIYINLI